MLPFLLLFFKNNENKINDTVGFVKERSGWIWILRF